MKTKKAINYVLSLGTILGLVYLVILNTPNPKMNFAAYKPYAFTLLTGFGWTILISFFIFFLSFILGFVMFFGAKIRFMYIKYLISHITNIMFGSPMLVVIIATYFFVGTALQIYNKLFWGIVTLTVYFAPFMMKLFIGAFESINRNQIVVCDIFGFSKFQMYRYVILPQMFRIMLPPLSGNLATIVKSSSLLYLIGFNEFYYNITTVQSRTFAFTEGYILMFIAYLVITIPLIKLTDYLEKKVAI